MGGSFLMPSHEAQPTSDVEVCDVTTAAITHAAPQTQQCFGLPLISPAAASDLSRAVPHGLSELPLPHFKPPTTLNAVFPGALTQDLMWSTQSVHTLHSAGGY